MFLGDRDKFNMPFITLAGIVCESEYAVVEKNHPRQGIPVDLSCHFVNCTRENKTRHDIWDNHHFRAIKVADDGLAVGCVCQCHNGVSV